MSQETPETIMHTWMRRVWNERDRGAVEELMAPHAVVHGLGDEPLRGHVGWWTFYDAFLGAFSDMHITIDDQVVSGDKVAIRFSATMTHRASGKELGLHSMAIGEIEDGQIVEGWNLVDFLPMLIDMSIAPGDAMDRAMAPPPGHSA